MANQVLMIVSTWGETDARGVARWMKWSDLSVELEAQLGAQPLAIFAVAARYGMQLDLEADRLTIMDLAAPS